MGDVLQLLWSMEHLKQYTYIQNNPTEVGIEDYLNTIKVRLNI